MNIEDTTAAELLKASFPWIVNNTKDSIEDHEKWSEMRMHLALFYPSDKIYYIPFILYDLLLTHSNDWANSDNAEFVLMQLDVEKIYPETYYKEIAENIIAPIIFCQDLLSYELGVTQTDRAHQKMLTCRSRSKQSVILSLDPVEKIAYL